MQVNNSNHYMGAGPWPAVFLSTALDVSLVCGGIQDQVSSASPLIGAGLHGLTGYGLFCMGTTSKEDRNTMALYGLSELGKCVGYITQGHGCGVAGAVIVGLGVVSQLVIGAVRDPVQ